MYPIFKKPLIKIGFTVTGIVILCYNAAVDFFHPFAGITLRLLGFYWGVTGVILFLGYAIVRLTPRMLELADYSLGPLHWISLIVFVPWMAWTEGYKGFHQAFSPRVVARARHLRSESHPVLALLAPVFCMGYIHATRKRKIVSWILTICIVGLVMLLRITPQPWRGIVDAGVITGLGLGILSLLYFLLKAEKGEWTHPIALDLPDNNQTLNQEEPL